MAGDLQRVEFSWSFEDFTGKRNRVANFARKIHILSCFRDGVKIGGCSAFLIESIEANVFQEVPDAELVVAFRGYIVRDQDAEVAQRIFLEERCLFATSDVRHGKTLCEISLLTKVMEEDRAIIGPEDVEDADDGLPSSADLIDAVNRHLNLTDEESDDDVEHN